MNNIGSPVIIQNTDAGEWIVRIDDVATSSGGESVSIVSAIPRDPAATLPGVQARAVARAIELLQGWQANLP